MEDTEQYTCTKCKYDFSFKTKQYATTRLKCPYCGGSDNLKQRK